VIIKRSLRGSQKGAQRRRLKRETKTAKRLSKEHR
jgi:hypothetical protein